MSTKRLSAGVTTSLAICRKVVARLSRSSASGYLPRAASPSASSVSNSAFARNSRDDLPTLMSVVRVSRRSILSRWASRRSSMPDFCFSRRSTIVAWIWSPRAITCFELLRQRVVVPEPDEFIFGIDEGVFGAAQLREVGAVFVGGEGFDVGSPELALLEFGETSLEGFAARAACERKKQEAPRR